MSEEIQPADLPAIAAFGAWIGQTETARILLSWRERSEEEHADWRRVAAAVATALGALECTPLAAQPEPEQRYALVEQMGFRRTYGTVRETEFCGKPMLEVTSLETGAVTLAAPESLYALTWLTRQQAESATRTGSHSPKALSAAIADDLASWGADDEYDREQSDEGNRVGLVHEPDDDRDHHGDEDDEASYHAHRAAEADL